MNIYVMSDIHGDFEAYKKMLTKIEFNKFENNDILYIAGDVVDRGPGSIKILKHIMKNQNKITMLMGNHEDLMIRELEIIINESNKFENMIKNHKVYDEIINGIWFRNGGQETYLEYIGESIKTRLEIYEFIKNLKYNAIVDTENESYYIVHGRPEGYESVKDEPIISKLSQKEKMIWGRYSDDEITNKIKQIAVFGHTCVARYDERFLNDELWPEHYEIVNNIEKRYIAIDCGVSQKNKFSRLSCIRLNDLKEYYV